MPQGRSRATGVGIQALSESLACSMCTNFCNSALVAAAAGEARIWTRNFGVLTFEIIRLGLVSNSYYFTHLAINHPVVFNQPS